MSTPLEELFVKPTGEMDSIEYVIFMAGHELDLQENAADALNDYNQIRKIIQAARGLVEYRKRNTLNFQLEKADDFIREMENNFA